MATIEQFYRVRIDFDCDDPDSVADAILELKGTPAKCNVFTGNACCYPYVEASDVDANKLRLWADKVERLILRRKGGKLNP